MTKIVRNRKRLLPSILIPIAVIALAITAAITGITMGTGVESNAATTTAQDLIPRNYREGSTSGWVRWYDFTFTCTNTSVTNEAGLIRKNSYTSADCEYTYCIKPSYRGPDPGDVLSVNSNSSVENDIGTTNYELLRAIMWFAPGGPGYDASIWPTGRGTSGDSGMSTFEKKYFDAHFLLGYVYNYDTNLNGGMNQTSITWLNQYVYGQALKTIKSRMGEVPPRSSFDIYFANHRNNRRQTVIGAVYVPNGDIYINKTSSNLDITNGREDHYSLAGAQYTVYNSSNKAVLTLTTDENGYAQTNGGALAGGRYTVRETKSPVPYEINDTVYTVDVVGGKLTPVQTPEPPKDTPRVGKIVVTKTDSETGQPVRAAGFQFTLYNENGEQLQQLTTDESGTVTFENLPFDVYTLKETDVVAPYLINTETQTIDLTASDANVTTGFQAKVPNDMVKGHATISKAYGDIKLVDATFNVVTTENIVTPGGIVNIPEGTVVDTVTTGEDGTATTKDLYIGSDGDGKYAFVETDSPSGFVIDQTPVPFTLTYKDNVTSVVINDEGTQTKENKPNTIIPTKKDGLDDSVVSGATFGLWRVEDEIAVTPAENSDAIAIRTDDEAKLRLAEKDADTAAAITLSTDMSAFGKVLLTDASGESVELAANTRFPAKSDESYTVSMVDANDADAGLAGTTEIKPAAGKAYAITIESTADGYEASIEESDYDASAEFVYDEAQDAWVNTTLATGTSYELYDGDKYIATIATSEKGGTIHYGRYGDTKYSTYENGYLRQGMLTKSDDAIMTEIDVNGTKLPVAQITGEDGKLLIEAIPTGSFGFGEVAPKTIDAGTDRQYIISATVYYITSDAVTGKLTIDRIVSPYTAPSDLIDDETTDDATDENGKQDATTDGTGDVTDGDAVADDAATEDSTDLPTSDEPESDGSAADGEQTDEDEDSNVVEVNSEPADEINPEFVNDKTRLYVSKLDITNEKELLGAHLVIENSDGEVVEEWESTDEPHYVEALKPGDYTLIEVITPKNYDQATRVDFRVEDTGEIQTVAMHDEPISIDAEIDKRQEIADPTVEGTEANGDDANRAEVSVSDDGYYDYSLDFRSNSNTWTDEFTVIDTLDCATQDLAHLVSITTPQAYQDYDGLMNVWYQTNKTPSDYVDPSGANATVSDGHKNPWLDDKEAMSADEDGDKRVIDYKGWKLWKANVPATVATELSVSDLNLAEGEYVTAFRFEYGRVEVGFTTRQDRWDDELLKDEHDDMDDIESLHSDTFTGSELEGKIANLNKIRKLAETVESVKFYDVNNMPGDNADGSSESADENADDGALHLGDDVEDGSNGSNGSEVTDEEKPEFNVFDDYDERIAETIDSGDDEQLVTLLDEITDEVVKALRNKLDEATEGNDCAPIVDAIDEYIATVEPPVDDDVMESFRTALTTLASGMDTGDADAIATARKTVDDSIRVLAEALRDSIDESVSTEIQYAPAVVHMQVTDNYTPGTPLDNSAHVDAYRNGGGEGLEGHDDDFVTQQTRMSDLASDLVQTGAPFIGGAIGTAVAAGAGYVIIDRMRRRK